MNVSFDGMRRSATGSMNRLHRIIYDVISNGEINKDQIDDIKEVFNDAAMDVDIFNCLFDDSEENDMNDLSEELSIERFEV
jgi:hypothetical protein